MCFLRTCICFGNLLRILCLVFNFPPANKLDSVCTTSLTLALALVDLTLYLPIWEKCLREGENVSVDQVRGALGGWMNFVTC